MSTPHNMTAESADAPLPNRRQHNIPHKSFESEGKRHAHVIAMHGCPPVDFTGRTDKDVVALGVRLGLRNVVEMMRSARGGVIRLAGTPIFVTIRTSSTDKALSDLRYEGMADTYGLLERRLAVPHNGRGHLLDIGGHVGTTALLYAKSHPGEMVYTFEPHPVSFFFLAWNAVANNLTSSLVMRNTGISSDGKPFAMSYAPDGNSMSSVRAAKGGNLRVPMTRTLTLRELSVGRCIPFENIASIKLDCEGCEFDVVPNMKDFFASTSVRVFGEYHAFHASHGRLGWTTQQIQDTWRVLCSRDKQRGDCIEWLDCDNAFGNPYSILKRLQLSPRQLRGAHDVRICGNFFYQNSRRRYFQFIDNR